MADFSYLSDSSNEDAVEDLLNQAMDQSALEQIAKINCSSFSSDSVLPLHLEKRFTRLKTFPVSNPYKDSYLSAETKPYANFGKKNEGEAEPFFDGLRVSEKNPVGENKSKPNSTSESGYFSSELHNPKESTTISPDWKEIRGLKKNLGTGSGSSPSNSSNSSGQNSGKENGMKSKSRTGSFLSSPWNPSDFSRDSPSPPHKKQGCFWCSPKKGSQRKSKEYRGSGGTGVNPGGIDREFPSDLSVFSAKQQQKLLKKAMREEEKISREAEKIVKWAKQGSARMNISDIEDDDELGDTHIFNTR